MKAVFPPATRRRITKISENRFSSMTYAENTTIFMHRGKHVLSEIIPFSSLLPETKVML
ncbi:MAG: hypothetical protein ACR2PT_07625 [Endozoicomonas sp.]